MTDAIAQLIGATIGTTIGLGIFYLRLRTIREERREQIERLRRGRDIYR